MDIQVTNSNDEYQVKKKMLEAIRSGLQAYINEQPDLKGKILDKSDQVLAQKAITHYFDILNTLQNQPSESSERAKLKQMRSHIDGLLACLHESEMSVEANHENGGLEVRLVSYCQPELLDVALLNDLDTWLEDYPIIPEPSTPSDMDEMNAPKCERFNAVDLIGLLKYIRSWSLDIEDELGFTGKPKAGGAFAKSRRGVIDKMIRLWTYTTGQDVGCGYHGGQFHKDYDGPLLRIIHTCLKIAGHRFLSRDGDSTSAEQDMIGRDMDLVRRKRARRTKVV